MNLSGIGEKKQVLWVTDKHIITEITEDFEN